MMRESLRNEILADIKADVVVTTARLDSLREELRRETIAVGAAPKRRPALPSDGYER